MAEMKVFNNVIIGQFVITGVPVKVYAGSRFLTLTDVDDVESPYMGFGMDEDGDMVQFRYTDVEFLSVNGNKVDIETYNKGMEAKFSGGDEESKEEPAEEEGEEKDKPAEQPSAEDMKDHYIPSIKDLIKEISKDEADAEQLAIDAMAAAGDAKIKAAKEKEKELKKKPIDEDNQSYTFGVGDIVKNKNTSCPHHGSIGVVKKIMNLPNEMGTVAIYTVMNSGPTYKAGDSLTKTIDQLEPITKTYLKGLDGKKFQKRCLVQKQVMQKKVARSQLI